MHNVTKVFLGQTICRTKIEQTIVCSVEALVFNLFLSLFDKTKMGIYIFYNLCHRSNVSICSLQLDCTIFQTTRFQSNVESKKSFPKIFDSNKFYEK